MSAISVSRFRRMSGHEVSWRARQTGRRAAQRLAVRVRPPRWNRQDLREVIADGVLEQLFGGDGADPPWQEVHAELRRLIAERSSRFTLSHASARDVRDEVLSRWPGAALEAATRADIILAGRYDVLGYRGLSWISPGASVDWHLDPVSGLRAPLLFWADVPYLDPSIGDHKVIWELNRHQHWLRLGRALWLTGDARYRQEMIQQLEAWIAANPPLVGINWASMLEIGLRAISWIWGLHFLLADNGIGDPGSGIRGDPGAPDPGSRIPDPDPPWLVDMLVALDRQLTHLEQNLSVYFSPNTHLTGEALGLYVVGVALPELAASARWRDTGRRILLEEISRQIHDDGGHAEQSTHYHRYTLDFYLMALLTAERDGDAEAVRRFGDAARRLAEYARAMADDQGRLPSIGDDDGGMLWPFAGRACHDVRDSLSLAAVLLDRADLAPWGLQEEAVWIAGPRTLDRERHVAPASRAAAPASSRTFADSGFVVVRDSAGGHAIFDVGRHGYLNGGHAHADALSVTLSLRGQPLLVDPGTSTYTMNTRLRDLLRSTTSHNTVTVDDRSQGVPRGPFHWRTCSDARLHGSRSNESFHWTEASHDGYAPVRHRRTLVRTARGEWFIADEVLGVGPLYGFKRECVTARAHWHFDPGWTLRCDAPGRLLATHLDGRDAWLLHDAGEVLLAHGDEESGLGWYAPVYGTLVPTWTVRTTRRSNAPFMLLTWISERDVAPVTPSLERLDPPRDAEGTAIAARVVDNQRRSVFLLRPGEPPVRDSRRCDILDYQTNARVLHYVEADGRFVEIDLIDASHAVSVRQGLVSITAAESMADLHVSLSNDVLDLVSSNPPSQLRLQGIDLCGLRQVHLNHRAIDLSPADYPDALVIQGVDWAPAAASPNVDHAKSGYKPSNTSPHKRAIAL